MTIEEAVTIDDAVQFILLTAMLLVSLFVVVLVVLFVGARVNLWCWKRSWKRTIAPRQDTVRLENHYVSRRPWW